jgi:hypothetical protein
MKENTLAFVAPGRPLQAPQSWAPWWGLLALLDPWEIR